MLGISPENMEVLGNVSIVFHCAATVSFNEPLRKAIILNVGGTLEAMKVAETFRHLKLFVHVSTYYCNPQVKLLEEKVYEAPVDWRVCLNQWLSMDEQLLDALSHQLLGDFPNTYTFTKNITESMVKEYRLRIPVIIFRPAIVVYALDEPEPGFPPNLTGAMGIFVLTGAGILKTVYMADDVILQMAPQDASTKAMLYYGIRGASIYKQHSDMANRSIPLYNCSFSNEVPMSIKTVSDIGFKLNLWYKNAFEKSLLLPGIVFTTIRPLYMLRVFVMQILPALMVDGALRLCGQKPILMSVQRRAFLTLEVLKPFMLKNFPSTGVTDIKQYLADTEGTELGLGEWPVKGKRYDGVVQIIKLMPPMVRQILMKEDISTLARSRIIFKIKIIIYNIIRLVIAFYVLRWCCKELINLFH